jgi:hypothetical protein
VIHNGLRRHEGTASLPSMAVERGEES